MLNGSPRESTPAADHTAVRVALWRALHLRADPPPHVIEDEVGLRIADPGDDWRERPDMDVDATRRTRASIVARARFVEDLVVARAGREWISTSSSAPVWTRSPSVGRRSPPGSGCASSRPTSQARRPGSGSGWRTSATTSPSG